MTGEATVTLPGRSLPLLATVSPRGGLLQAVACALFGSLLLALSAKVQVPFWPVPMTLQSLAVLLVGMAYGSRLAALTVGIYLGEGLLGLPVFAGPTAGADYMSGPTAGYLMGFLMAAWFTGWLAERGWDRSPAKALAAMALGHAVLFAFGVAWLAALFGIAKAVAVGLAPFWAATLLKTLLGAAIMQAAWRFVERRSQAA